MSTCDLLDRFLDQDLSPSEGELFSAHLQECASCRTAVEDWSVFTETVGLLEAAERQRLTAANRKTPADLAATLHARERASGFVPYWPWAVAAVLVLGVGVGVFVQQSRKAEKEPPLHSVHYVAVSGLVITDDRSAATTWKYGEKIAMPKGSRALLRVDGATIGVRDNSIVEVLSTGEGNTTIRLQQGSVAADVDKRKPGDKFVVTIAPYAVRVVGTQFSVQAADDGIVVSVVHGVVDIYKGHRRVHRVRGGLRVSVGNNGGVQSVALDDVQRSAVKALLSKKQPRQRVSEPTAAASSRESSVWKGAGADRSPKAATISVDYEQWESWIVQGRYDSVRRVLKRRLRDAPRDTRAWSLLGDCEKRAHNWQAAVRAYEQVIALGDTATARTARFKAGVIYQEKLGNHAAAEKMFRRFVADSHSTTLIAQGMLRQAKSLLALGKRVQANDILVQITTRYAETTAAVEAHELLNR